MLDLLGGSREVAIVGCCVVARRGQVHFTLLTDLIALPRYHTNVPSAKSAKDWSKAEQYYRAAARVYPSGGNAHNQLAVLATYRNDELSAVYHYVWSLAVAEPFLIARENLLLLFEQNRKRWVRSSDAM